MNEDKEERMAVVEQAVKDACKEFERLGRTVSIFADETYGEEDWKYLVPYLGQLSHLISAYLDFSLRASMPAENAEEVTKALHRDSVRTRAKIDQVLAKMRDEKE